MKKIIISTVAAILPAVMFGQSAIDAFNLSQTDHRGTARFMSMGGAFTALGGDLSTLNQNPGGIGVYRSNEIGATLDIDIMSTSSLTQGYKQSKSKTSVGCNNFGYIGAVYTNSDIMPYFNWGASYSRVSSFDRAYRGTIGNLGGSLSNRIAMTASGKWPSGELSGVDEFGEEKNPYWESNAPWLTILAYNAYLINPFSPNGYNGLMQDGTTGIGTFDVQEKGYVDEYSLNFGGNFVDMVYWGIGIGITDIDYKSSVYYTEDFQKAKIPDFDEDGYDAGTVTGAGGYGLDSWKHISGTGYNFKFGLIFKPINELRIGMAVHTPTFYTLKQEGWAGVDYGFGSGKSGYVETDEGYTDYFEWKLRTPWRMMVGVSGVIGKKAIVSLDYEYRPMQNMSVRNDDNNEYYAINEDVKNYYNSVNIVRLGAEYRLDRHWSIRGGYQIQTSPSTEYARNGGVINTEGPKETETTPSYSFDKSTRYISCGIGYRYNNFYVDATYVNKQRESKWSAFTPSKKPDEWKWTTPETSKITLSSNQIVLSAGFKF